MPRPSWALGAALLLTALAPVAAGQPTTSSSELAVHVAPEDRGGIIAPGTTVTWTVVVEYNVSETALAWNRTEIAVRVSSRPPWATVDLGATYLYVDVPLDPRAGTATNRTEVEIAVDAAAPLNGTRAYHAGENRLFIDARAEPNGNVKASSAREVVPVWTGRRPGVEIAADPPRLDLRGGETGRLTVELRNTGNTGEVVEISANRTSGLDVDGPGTVRLGRDEVVETNLSVRADGWLASGSRSLGLQAIPRRGDVVGPTADLTVPVEVTPLPAAVLLGEQTITEVAGFSAALVVASLLAGWPMTTWWRRRKQDRT